MRKIFILALCAFTISCTERVVVEIENQTDFSRDSESVELLLSTIEQQLGATNEFVVLNSEGDEIASQVCGDILLFQVDVEPNSVAEYIIKAGKPQEYKVKAYGRLVPERMDDWTWENDKIAFRVYGPALEATGEISNGIDIWVKSTEELIIDKWYQKGYNYHKDQGEGLDCYKVGRTLGSGAMAPVFEDTLRLGRNFVKAELLDSGALRTTVRLDYSPYMAGDVEVSEQRVITLDVGSNFNRIVSTFSTSKPELEVAAAIVLVDGGEVNALENAVSYSGANDLKNGMTHSAIILNDRSILDTLQNHVVLRTQIKSGTPYLYYSGAGWSKSEFPTVESWYKEVENEILRIKNPLKVTIK